MSEARPQRSVAERSRVRDSSPSGVSRGGVSTVREFQRLTSLHDVIEQAQDADLLRLRREAENREQWRQHFVNDPILENHDGVAILEIDVPRDLQNQE